MKLGKARVCTHSELCPLCGTWRNKFKQDCAPKDGGTSGGAQGESQPRVFASCTFGFHFINREESSKVFRLLAIHTFPLWIFFFFLSDSYEPFNHLDTFSTYTVRETVLWQSTLGTLREQTKPCVSTFKGKSDERSYRATSQCGNPSKGRLCAPKHAKVKGSIPGEDPDTPLSALHIPSK